MLLREQQVARTSSASMASFLLELWATEQQALNGVHLFFVSGNFSNVGVQGESLPWLCQQRGPSTALRASEQVFEIKANTPCFLFTSGWAVWNFAATRLIFNPIMSLDLIVSLSITIGKSRNAQLLLSLPLALYLSSEDSISMRRRELTICLCS